MTISGFITLVIVMGIWYFVVSTTISNYKKYGFTKSVHMLNVLILSSISNLLITLFSISVMIDFRITFENAIIAVSMLLVGFFGFIFSVGLYTKVRKVLKNYKKCNEKKRQIIVKQRKLRY